MDDELPSWYDHSLFLPGEYLEDEQEQEIEPTITPRAEKEMEDQIAGPAVELPHEIPAEWVSSRPILTTIENDEESGTHIVAAGREVDYGKGVKFDCVSVWTPSNKLLWGRSRSPYVNLLGNSRNSDSLAVPWDMLFAIRAPPSVTQFFDKAIIGRWLGFALALGATHQRKKYLLLPVPVIETIASYAAQALLIPIRFSLSQLARDTSLPTRLIQIAAMEAVWPHWKDWASCHWTLQPMAFPTMDQIVAFIQAEIAPHFHFYYVNSLHAFLISQHAVEVTINGLEPLLLQNYYKACLAGELVFNSQISGLFKSFGVCFGPQATVVVGSGRKIIRQVYDLRVDDKVATGSKQYPVSTVLCTWRCILTSLTPVYSLKQNDGALLQITLDHPIRTHGKWCLPSPHSLSYTKQIPSHHNNAPTSGSSASTSESLPSLKLELESQPEPKLEYLPPGTTVYNFVLRGPCRTLLVGGIRCCTLGMAVPNHYEPFWGTSKVTQWLQLHPMFPNVVTVKACI
ncbi:hypothetical protein Pelo_4592 [Pelomyxa schiedti]|nr:hypothetical protein Pelo_4592 [Pelomyxa schiedti]